MKFETPTLSIIVPNWNGKMLLEKYLPAVIAASHGAEIIVADDASTDNSVSFVKSKYPEVVIIQNENHSGFASTVNAGVRASSGELVVLLNTDVEPAKDFLTPLAYHFQDPVVFAVGCMDVSIEQGAKVYRGRGLDRWERGMYLHNRGEIDATDTAWVSGGSGMFRRSMWDTLGGMDTLYNPYYWEDIDISYRARKSGYTIIFEPKSLVTHRHSEGTIQSTQKKNSVENVAYRNQFIFIWKNISSVKLMVNHIMWLPYHVMRAILSGNVQLVSGFISAVLKLPAVIHQKMNHAKYWKISDEVLLSDQKKL